MKILYFCHERLDAQNLATALRTVAKNGTVSWTSSVDRAAKWFDDNKDVAALVLESQLDGTAGTAVLKHVRSLGLRPAVVVVTPEGTGPRLGPLAAAADDHVEKHSARFRDLPAILTRTVARLRGPEAAPPGPLTPAVAAPTQAAAAPAVREAAPDASASWKDALRSDQRDDLEQKLAHATAALRDAEQRHLAAMATASEQLAERQLKYDLATAQSTARWQRVDEQLRTAALEAENARQSEAAGAAELERLSQRETELSSCLAEATASNSALAQRIAEAEAAFEATHTQAAQDRAAAAAQLDSLRRELQAEIARETDQRHKVEAALADTIRARDEAETELSSRLAEATASNSALAQRIAEAEAALEAAHTQAAQDRAAAAAQLESRRRELQAEIARETEQRHKVEAALADAMRARDEAETRRAAAMMDAAAQLRELDAALTRSRDEQATTAAEVERLTARGADLDATLSGITTSHANLERRLAATEAAFQDADTRATNERLEATRKAAAREAELDGVIRQERAKAVALEKTIASGEAALREARQEHESAMAIAAAELARQKADADRELARAIGDRDRTAEHLAEVEAALELSKGEHKSATTEVGRLTEREAELTTQIGGVSSELAAVRAAREKAEGELLDARTAIESGASREAALEERIRQEAAARATLEQAVADGEAVLRETRQRHDDAAAKAAHELSERQAQFDRERSASETERDRLNARLVEVGNALDSLRSDHQTATADVARLTGREADLTSQLAEIQSARRQLELDLAEAIANVNGVEAQLRQERATRTSLEQAVADGEAARRDDQQRHEAVLAAKAGELAGEQARFDRERSEAAADRSRLDQRLTETEHALEQARTDHQAARADVTRLTGRESALTAQIADVEEARQSVAAELAEAVKTIAETNEQSARERAQAAGRETDLNGRLTKETEARTTLARVLEETRSAARDAQRSFQQQADRLHALAQEQKATLEGQLARERGEHETRWAELQTRHNALTVERDRLQHALAVIEERAQQLDADLRTSREQSERSRHAAASDIKRLTEALEESGRVLETTRSESHAALERRNKEHATALDARHRENQQLQEKIAATVRELETTTRHLEAARVEAGRLSPLQKELEDSRSESARLFQQAGLAMFRCTRGGELKQTNRAGMTLVGRRTTDELRGANFATTVFEDPNALSWLIERCLTTRTRESIETTWRRKDGGRLFVRLSAYASAPDVVEIVAEDLTRVRVLQERLGQAHRMEAVGRLASEVAVTCGNLLNDVHHDVQASLAAVDATASSRQQGQHLLAELTRAAGFLQQLAAYGDEQARTPGLADLNTVIRDLEPVLKRVAGDAVDVHLTQAASRLNVDVDTERVERLLVNLASFARGRMPSGGQLKIDLSTTIVDRRFVAKHPNVRLGPHALITVTESKRSRKADGLLHLRDNGGERTPEKPTQKPGMDFGTLQGLVSGCGGHLWMTVQPQGDMVAKIHLPLLTSFDQPAPRVMALRGVRERAMALFHH